MMRMLLCTRGGGEVLSYLSDDIIENYSLTLGIYCSLYIKKKKKTTIGFYKPYCRMINCPQLWHIFLNLKSDF